MCICLRLGVFLAMCVSVCMRKGSRNSQYLSEISAWNHDRPDLSSVMEPDRVSSGFSTQTPHKPQSKSTKERERERQTERAQEQFGISRSSHYHATAFQHQRERKKGCGKNQGDGIKVLQTEWENMPTDRQEHHTRARWQCLYRRAARQTGV